MSVPGIHPVRAGVIDRAGPRLLVVAPDAVLSALALGALVFIPVLGKIGVLAFLAAGGLLALGRPTATLLVCIRYWPVLLLPLYCLGTALWSQYPALSARFGLQLTATVVIALLITTGLSARSFCRILFGLFAIAMLASIGLGEVRGDTGAWLGIYGSKNALAGAAAVFVVIALGQALDRGASPSFRLSALLGVTLGAGLLMLAQSVSALLVVPVAIGAILVISVQHRLQPMTRIVTLAFALLALAVAAVIVASNIDILSLALLEATGKDLTLTGRTDLWQIAGGLIAERPLFGLGYQAFWVHGNPTAEALWAMFGIDGRAGFNFHNTYLSNAVEIGLVGVAFQVLVLFGALILTGLWAVREARPHAALLFALVLMVVVVSFVEVPVFFQFSLRSVIVICALIYATRALGDQAKTTARA